VEQEALERESAFHHEKESWMVQIESMKHHVHGVLAAYEETYTRKTQQLEQEYQLNRENAARRADTLAAQERDLNADRALFERQKQEMQDTLAFLKKRLDEETRKPTVHNVPGRVTPLVAEIINDQPIFADLLANLRGRLARRYEQIFKSRSGKDKKLSEEIGAATRHIFDETVRAVEPFSMAVQDASLKIILDETLKPYESVCQEHRITIHRHFDENMPDIPLDPSYAQQAFQGIIQNAIDAMPDGGNLVVSLVRAPDQDAVKVIFEDRGIGMAPDHLQKTTTPFFTTKEGGAGMCLYRAKLILNALNAGLIIDSTKNTGTVATCLFYQQINEAKNM
jgi:signal transduction histidine kinase